MDGGADGRGQAPPRAAAARAITRMAPKRAEQILDGGSLYWVVKGLISARQRSSGLEPFVDADGIGRCKIWLGADRGRGRAAADARLPGLALLSGEDAPPDIDEAQPGFAAMPDAMRRELAGLGLL